MKIILASTSKYRADLLARLGLPFEQVKPHIDEEALKLQLERQSCTPLEIAENLSRQKGASVYKTYPEATVISGDQLVTYLGQILGKPGTSEKALEQLKFLNGGIHEIITSTTLVIGSNVLHNNNVATMKMKQLSDEEMKAYVKLDQPLDCAGSIKIENFGISLFEKIDCEDFTAIQGLPLIWISNTLKRNGYELFKK